MEIIRNAFRFDYEGRVNRLMTPCSVVKPIEIYGNPSERQKHIGLWDTGATNSVISEEVVRSLGLHPIGKTETYGVHGSQEVPIYMIDIFLPDGVRIKDLQVTQGLFPDFHVLIGMDIIQIGDFNISNAGGKTTFSYCIPSHETDICLLEKTNKVNARVAKKMRRIRQV